MPQVTSIGEAGASTPHTALTNATISGKGRSIIVIRVQIVVLSVLGWYNGLTKVLPFTGRATAQWQNTQFGTQRVPGSVPGISSQGWGRPPFKCCHRTLEIILS